MVEQKRVISIVAARGGSKGLPGKNLYHLDGRPLVAWPVAAALGAASVSRVIISTDDEAIAKAANLAGADVPFMRPAHLASDTASSMDVVMHSLDTLEAQGDEYDYVVLLEPTSPLTESSDIDAAFSKLHATRGKADAIVGICGVESTHPEYDVRINAEGLITPFLMPDFKSLRRRQEVEKLYFLEGSLYISCVKAFRRYKTFFHDRTLGYEVPRWKSLEVDDIFDLIMIEAVVQRRDEFLIDG
jgi:N-acylneuraminate cytidylyltransferase/CMP-N,N'-diacetyllegionaminic acid synthase